MRLLLGLVGLLLIVQFSSLIVVDSNYFKPFNVSYDGRAMIVDGKRRILISGAIHYPRATPEMWPSLISKSKEGGLDVIETYVFWNGHEPTREEFNFEGRYDLVKFVKEVGSSGLYLFLRIGPYVCAEWNFGGFPVWLRDVPGIEFRTDNKPFKDEMERFVKKIVELMREESLFSWQGGPIIMLQIENEYGNIESSYGAGGKEYMKWAANMAVGLGAGVPWVMCKQTDAPEFILDSCNGYYCDGFKPNSKKKPILWTENWDGWYTSWGDRLPHRPAEDLAFAVARFYQRGGSFQNYYMYFGGTNFARTSGGPNYITSYDYDAPLDEYGLLSQPKWGHLKDLHAAIKLCEPALVAVDSPQYIKLGSKQEAHVYSDKGSKCSAFLANIDEHKTVNVKFRNKAYKLPPWSVSILPDCKNVVFNTAKIGAQTSIKTVAADNSNDRSPLESILVRESAHVSKSWSFIKEPVGAWGDSNFTHRGILEHLNVTKDLSDYLWYTTRLYISNEDISFWGENQASPMLTIDSMRDLVYVFVNGEFKGSGRGKWTSVKQRLNNLVQGYNDIALLSQTVGLQNYGAFLERDGAGFRGDIKLTGCRNGDVNLTKSAWTYQVGLKGEFSKIYTLDHEKEATKEWSDLPIDAIATPFSWYKTNFDAPSGVDPVALNMRSMGKGQAWVNGHHIGRYWTLKAPENGCKPCDYRGSYDSDKCVTGCGDQTQSWYHIPRSWLKATDNLLIIFEELENNPFEISIGSYSTQSVCAEVSEDHYPPLHSRLHSNSTVPEMHLQCDSGNVISSIDFASYGTPKGSCRDFSIGSCHGPESVSVVSQACLGKESCSISISNAVFGGDPCHGVVKTLSVQSRCSPPSSTQVI